MSYTSMGIKIDVDINIWSVWYIPVSTYQSNWYKKPWKKNITKTQSFKGQKKLALTLWKNRLPQCIGSTLLSQ